MPKAEKRGNRWRCRVMVNGVSMSFTADTKKEAERLAAMACDTEKAKTEKITFEEAVASYIDSKSNILSPSTIRGYKADLRNNIDDRTKKIRIDKITSQDLQRCVNECAKAHSYKTCANTKGLITATLAMFRPDLSVRLTLPPKEKSEKAIPTEEEVKRLAAAAEGTDLELPILLAAFGSCRRSEICALMPDCVFDDHIEIRRAKILDEHQKYVINDHPKTYAGYRSIHLPESVMEKVKAAAAKTKPGETIVKRTPLRIAADLRDLEKKEGFATLYGLHAFRHFFATFCHALGIPDQYIMKMGGWDDIQTLTKIYQHTLKSKEDDVTNKIDHFYSMLIDEKM